MEKNDKVERLYTPDASREKLMQYFKYNHLPSHLQASSKPFHDLAWHIVGTVPPCDERTVSLRKLLEAKDCAVRAML